jgi:hypothetical protein
VPFRNLGEEWIGREEQIDAERTAIARSKPLVLLAQGEVREARQILHRDDQIDVPCVSSIHVLKQGESADENVRKSIIGKGMDETFRLGEKRFLIHGGWLRLDQSIPEYRTQIIPPP